MVIMEEQFPAELLREVAYNRIGKFKKIVHMPSNASAMTDIQRAFKSYLASNALINPPSPQGIPSPFFFSEKLMG